MRSVLWKLKKYLLWLNIGAARLIRLRQELRREILYFPLDSGAIFVDENFKVTFRHLDKIPEC